MVTARLAAVWSETVAAYPVEYGKPRDWVAAGSEVLGYQKIADTTYQDCECIVGGAWRDVPRGYLMGVVMGTGQLMPIERTLVYRTPAGRVQRQSVKISILGPRAAKLLTLAIMPAPA